MTDAAARSEQHFRRALRLVVAAPFLLFAAALAFAAWQLTGLLGAMADVDRTTEVIAQARLAEKLAIDLETGVRGYLITGDDRFLEPYIMGRQRVGPALAELDALVAADPAQRSVLRSARQRLQSWIDLAELRTAPHDGGTEQGRAQANEGRDRMDAVRQAMQQFIVGEQRLRGERNDRAHASARRSLLAILGSLMAAAAVAAAISWRQLSSVSRAYGSALEEAARRADTEQAARERLAQSEESFRRLAETLPDGVFVHWQGRIVFANEVLAELVSASNPAALVGREVIELFAPEDRDLVRERVKALGEGAPAVATRELRLLGADGSRVPIESTARRISFMGEGRIISIVRDLRERYEMLSKLMAMDRLATVGTLAAGIGHEINNPLAYVVANLEHASQLLASGVRDPDSLSAALADAREGVGRIRLIASDLKLFARADDQAVGPVDVRAVLDAAMRMAGPELKPRADVVRELDAAPRALGEPGRLGQVFLNLLVNAAQAIPWDRRGQVRVRCARRDSQVCIEIADDGVGIPAQHLGRIFDPFFTTKPVGQGTGLGLSIADRIVRSFGGEIHVASEVGVGTTVTVALRRAPDA